MRYLCVYTQTGGISMRRLTERRQFLSLLDQSPDLAKFYRRSTDNHVEIHNFVLRFLLVR